MPESIGYKQYKYSEAGKTQADGSFEIDLSNYHRYERHQVKVAVSGEPAAGTLSVYIKSPGAPEFDLVGSIDMTSTSQRIMRFTGNAEAVRFLPASFDSGKTYSIYGYVYEL